MNADDVLRILRADPGAYAEAYLICAGTLWFRHDITTTDRDKARDLLRGWQAAHQVQNRDGSSAVAALAYAMLDLGDALRETEKRDERP